MSVTTCRRGLLTAVAATPVLVLPIAAMASPAAEASGRWAELRVTYETARDTAERYHQTSYKPLSDEIEAVTGEAPSLLLARTALDGTVRHVRVTPGSSPADYLPGHRAQVATILREYQAWWARFETSERRPDWTAVRHQMDRLFDAEEAARRALMAEPAPDGPALAFKVQLALENDEVWPNERLALRRDASRLAARS